MPGFKPLKPSAAASTKPGRQPLLLQGCCSFLAVSVPALQPALCLRSLLLLGHSSLPFARLQTPKTPKTLHIPRGSFHHAPGRQRSSIAACPLPAHSLLLFGQCFAAEVLPLPSVPTASAVFLFHGLFFFAFLSGTCQCFIWHRFPEGVTCVTAMRPHDCEDHTTVEHTGQLCARHRVFLLTALSFT